MEIIKQLNAKNFIGKCSCGNILIIKNHELDIIKHCGCVLSNKDHPLYTRWKKMKARCYNPNEKYYHRYGGRGITVCSEWKDDFKAFAQWCMQNGFKDGLQIDRIDNDKGYSPDNCRFVTSKENNNNRSDNVRIDFMGNNYTLSQLAELLCVSRNSLSKFKFRLEKRGVSLSDNIILEWKKGVQV